jgi:(1->4)-alpha-D-glucan 1-alpha-D-glucosylmutase
MSNERARTAPTATYRLQLNAEFSLRDASSLVDHLERLGVSHLYLSPIFRARPGSPHGYDVVDHGSISPEIGGEDALKELSARLAARGMGIILDIVPNHMCIATQDNRWWNDVLENGPSSPFARYFDVDWGPPKPDLSEKVLLPILGEQYGRALENGEIRLIFENGAFSAVYQDRRLPVAPRSWSVVLERVLVRLRETLEPSDPRVLELESVLTAIRNMPLRSETTPERVQERQREKEIVKQRLAALAGVSSEVREAIDQALGFINGTPGDPRSFDLLETVLAGQAYRLSHWRVAGDEINYRRFFDVNDLAALRVEEPEVFEALHALPFRLITEGVVDGLRIDHVDGLLDPAVYLEKLPRDAYLVVEKILMGNERLRSDWPVDGTTGYDFLGLVGGLFVDRGARGALLACYAAFTGRDEPWSDVVYEAKKLALEVVLSSEATVLSRRLDRISEQHRFSRDFTLATLHDALVEVIACFPVYRTYVGASASVVSQDDRRHVEAAVRRAVRRNPATSTSLFDFIGSVLLLEHPEGLDAAQHAERHDFVLRFQQLTGPVMAKGLEDTAAYRHYPLASLNEVGCDPEVFGTSLERFHRMSSERMKSWPTSQSATSTHDTKRDEDVRARVSVLSEVPEAWEKALGRWRELNRAHKSEIEGQTLPDDNVEYLLYQTLVGTWPRARADDASWRGFEERIRAYLLKAVREAKVHTSWISPNEEYEKALDVFVGAALDPSLSAAFIEDFAAFVATVLRPGLLNSVSQTLLKATAPGVPDFYQGTEIWDFRLVDPDNRAPVDFPLRRRLLESLAAPDAPQAAELLASLEDGRLKLLVTARALACRRAHRETFLAGAYEPLHAAGELEELVVSFARGRGAESCIAVAARFFTRLPHPPVGAAWTGTALLVGEHGPFFRDVLTGRRLEARGSATDRRLALDQVFAELPVALLEKVS